MKAKIKLKRWILPNEDPTDGEIEFDLDETYWRCEFAKAALPIVVNHSIGNIIDSMKLQVSKAFDVADAMIEEMRKRNEK